MNEFTDVRPSGAAFPDFLGDSECGALIAARDWTPTLGPVDQWPVTLQTATAIILRAAVPMVILWGPDGIMLYNDGYAAFAGKRHPALLGSKVREGWPEAAGFNDNVMKTGLAGRTLRYLDQELTLYRNGRAEQVWMNLDYSPIVDPAGAPAGVLAIVAETTERVGAERALAMREERRAFFDSLAAATRELSDPNDLMAVTARMLGEYMQVSVCAYADMEPDQDAMTIRGDWAAPGSSSIVGTYSLAGFGKTALRELHAGRPLVTRDTLAELGPEEGKGLLSLGLQATVCMPLVKDGVLTALMAVHQANPRDWTDPDLALIREATERSWAHIERVRSQAVLAESEERLRLAADAAQIGTWDLDVSSGGGHWDEVALRLGGIAGGGEFHAVRWIDLVHPDDRERVSEAFQQALAAEGPPYDVVFKAAAPAADGGIRWMSSRGAVFRNASGEARRAVGIVRDITDQKRAEQALRESEERFRKVANSAPFMIWVTEPDGTCTYLNQRWYEYTGQEPGTGEGFGWLDAVHPDDRPRAEQAFVSANAEQRDYSVEFRLRRADGVYRWTLDAAAASFAPDGTFLGYVGSVMDIDERRESERQLMLKEEQLRLALEAGEVGLWDVDPIHGTMYWPPRVKAMFGISPDVQVTIDDFLDGLHPEDKEATAAAYESAGDPQRRTHYDVEYRTIGKEDGVIRWVAAKGRGVFENGTCVRMIGTAVDITARKKAEQHQRLLIDELSHRAKNLLAIVQSVALQSFRGNEPLAEMRAAFEGRLGALAAAHDILTRQNWESAPLSELVGATLAAVTASDGRVLLDGPGLLLPPKTGVSLAMAIHELATNALKYGSLQVPEGKVSVSWTVTGDRLNLEWREFDGPPVTPPARRGFGTRMIERGLAAELGGSVVMHFDPAGVVCTVDAPLPKVGK